MSQSEPLFKTIGHELRDQERIEEQRARIASERAALARTFARKASDLIWSYSPDVRVRQYNLSYAYQYLLPGVTSTPHIFLATDSQNVTVFVEADYIYSTNPHARPDTVRSRKIGIRFQSEGQDDYLAIEFDLEHNPVEATRPTDEDLMAGIKVLEYMEREYRRTNTKLAPQGYSN